MKNEIVEPNDSRLTAYAVGEMAPEEAKAFELELENSPAAREEVERIRETAELLREEFSVELEAAFAGRVETGEPPLTLVESGAVKSPPKERSFFPEMRTVIAALAAVLVGLAVVGVTWMKNGGNGKEIVIAEVDSTARNLEEGSPANRVNGSTESGGEIAFTGEQTDGVPPQAIATANAAQPLEFAPSPGLYLASAGADHLNLENRLYLGDDPILADVRTLGEDPVSGRPMFVPRNAGVATPAGAGLARGRDHAMVPPVMRFGYAIEGLDPAIPNPRNYVEVAGQITGNGKEETRSMYVVGKTTDRNGDTSDRIKGMVHVEEGAAEVAEKESPAKLGVAIATAPAPNSTGTGESFGGGGKLGNETAGGPPMAPGASANISASGGSGGSGGMVDSGFAGQLTAGLIQAEPPAKNRLKYARDRIQQQELEKKQLEQDFAGVMSKSRELDLANQGLSVPADAQTARPKPTAVTVPSRANDFSLDEASRRRVVIPVPNAAPAATLEATMPVEVDAFAADQSLAGSFDASALLNKADVGLFLPPEEPGFVGRSVPPPAPSKPVSGRGKFARTFDNPFKDPMETALSTFSIDVDTASFTETRRMILRDGQLPDRDQVRVEEFINYFNYDSYPAPDLAKLEEEEAAPFSVNLECAAAPWNPANRIVRIVLKGAEIPAGERPAANLVFLLDVSGSMKSEDKLPLLQKSLRELVPQLREDDRITIVVYASKAGEVLEPTPGNDSKTILSAINALTAKGSTNGEGGIRIAYERARENFIEDGVNRILLATDGDFNVGQDSDEELVSLIEKESKSGIELTVLGFGTGNLNDSMMEKITNKGNGQFHYIDRIEEGRRVLVEEMNSSLVTIAKDVKIQVEFNAGRVAAYRLIGYANRMMPREDFNDDTKDAGEIGAGHTVTALYEVVPVEALMQLTEAEPIDDLKYKKLAADEDGKAMSPLEQRRLAMKKRGIDLVNSPELLTVNLRYKQPGADVSEKLELPLVDPKKEFADASPDFRFATAVGAFGEWLRIRPASGHWNPDGNARQGRSNHQLEKIAEIAHRSIEGDEYGRKKELVEMIKSAATLNGGSISLEGAADDLIDEKAPAKGDVGTSVKEKLKQLR